MITDDLYLEVLEEFAAAQGMVERRVATEEGGLEALRKAYRERQVLRGLCRSCRRAAAPGRKSCPVHLHRACLRAYASQEREEQRT